MGDTMDGLDPELEPQVAEEDVQILATPKKRWTTGVALFVLLFGFLPGGIVLAYLIEKILS